MGSFITITGSGFAPAHDVGIEFGTTIITTYGVTSNYPTIASLLDTVGVTIPAPITGMIPCAVANPCIETDANGYFQAIIAVPPVVGGATTVTATDGVNTGTSAFTINAALLLTTSATSTGAFSSAFPDQSVTNINLVVTGFPASDSVTVTSPAFTASSGAGVQSQGGTFTSGAITTGTTTAQANQNGVVAPDASRSGILWTAGPGIGSLLGQTMTISETSAGGKVTVLATGTSGVTATTTFTINPVIGIFNAQSGATALTLTQFSIVQSGSLLLEGYGFAAGTIAQNSITITDHSGATETTQHVAVVIGSSGSFGAGDFNHLVAIPNSAPALGPASIVITDGTNTYTFNYANKNIIMANSCANQGAGNDCAGDAIPQSRLTGQTGATNAYALVGSNTIGFGAPFIVSAVGTGTSTGLGVLDASSYQPNNNVFVTLMAAGYAGAPGVVTSTGNPTVSIPGGTALTFGAGNTFSTDQNGASFVIGQGDGAATSCAGGAGGANTKCLDEEPYPVSPATSYTVSMPQGGNLLVGSVLSPSLVIQPWIKAGSSTISYASGGTLATDETVFLHGFTGGNTCTITSGSNSFTVNNGNGCFINALGASAAVAGGASAALPVVTPALAQVDLPGGANTITGGDGVVTGTANIFVLPVDLWGGTTTTTALSVTNPAPGTTVILRSGTTFGPHGLTANTAYTVVVDPGESSQATLGTFTANSAGQIPAPGVQFTVPALNSGYHAIGLLQGTTNVFWNVLATSLNGGSSVSSSATELVSSTALPVAGEATTGVAADKSNNQVSCWGVAPACTAVVGNQLRGQYGDGIMKVGAALTATPSAVTVGSATSSLTLTGSGLAPSQVYDVSIGAGPCNGALGPAVVATYTSSTTGTVPSGTTVPLSDYPAAAEGALPGGPISPELGTLYCAYSSTPSGFALGQNTGVATFDVQASMALSVSSTSIGSTVTVTAHGLSANTFYNIIFNPQTTITGFVSGQIVGGILANAVGAAAGTFNVPANAPAGTFVIQLQSALQIGAGVVSLANPPTLGVTTAAGSCSSQGTSCFTISGTPAQQTIGANQAIVATYTDNSNAAQTAVLYAVIHNASGQTVAYTTATVSPAAGASATGQLILFGLAPGTYTATVFATTTGGVAISITSTATVTIP